MEGRRPLHRLLLSILLGLALMAATPSWVAAKPHETRIELHDGKIRTADFSAAVCRALHISEKLAVDCGTIDAEGVEGSKFVAAMNGALGEGLRLSIDDGALLLHADPEKLPRNCDMLKKATRVFTALAAPEFTVDQASFYGMKLPETLDAARPLVVLVHGLDCDRANWYAMADLLNESGYQVAYFTYPSDQPIEDSAAMFGEALTKLHADVPAAKLDIVAHSMGGLVARCFVEGSHYCGGVEHLIMLGTPNRGSDWAKYHLLLEAQEHYHLWKHEPKWHWTWMITDGLGEAARDLKPGSAFLKHLNELPRRDEIKYTIVAGSQSAVAKVAGNCLEGSSKLISGRVANWWGFRQAKHGLENAADNVLHAKAKGDGPVRIKSTRLEGVDDFVIIRSDHASLYMSAGEGQPPAAWEIIRDRLAE